MDLGLDQLTDDQCLELLQEVLANLAGRDPYVRNLAQEAIVTESERLDAGKAAVAEAIRATKQTFIDQLKAEVREAVRRDISDPAVRLVTADEEAAIIAEGTLQARLEMIDDAISQMQQGLAGHLSFQVIGNHVILERGLHRMDLECVLDPQRLRELGHLMYQVIARP